MRATYEIWSGGRDRWDISNPASWTELHPPDLIEVRRGLHMKSEKLVGVAVVSNHCAIAPCPPEILDVEVPVPEEPRRLFPDGEVYVKERVSTVPGETNPATIEEGNADRTGARIDVLEDRVRIHVKVRGQPQFGAPGKFKAMYRVGWKARLPGS
jgi:hypothetical protein